MKSIHSLVLFLCALFSGTLYAGPEAGQPFPELTLNDQFDNPHTVTRQDKLILISFDRDVSNTVNAFLSKQPGAFLDDHHARYISDISAMPGIITRLFALPKMKDYNYQMMLATEDEFKTRFDHQEGKLTLYHLKDGTIESIEFIDPAKMADIFR